jgi:hypothetical protein
VKHFYLRVSRAEGKNNMIQPVPQFACIVSPERVSPARLPEITRRCGQFLAHGKYIMAGCLFLSLILHGLSGWLFEFRPVHQFVADRLLLLDIVAPRAVAVPDTEGSVPVSTSAVPAVKSPVRVPVPAKAVPEPQAVAPAVRRKPKVQQAAVKAARVGKEERRADVRTSVPVGQVMPQRGVTVLANESGQDALKHGSEARFMHGVATEEFVEENYIGEYSLGKLGRVWIEDDRARSGHLILHVEGIGLTRPLFRFNRFIYVYGENPDSPEPILGSVTFFSDGDRIHQFLMQHNSTHAYYPRRN